MAPVSQMCHEFALNIQSKKTWILLTKLLVSQEHEPTVRAKVKNKLNSFFFQRVVWSRPNMCENMDVFEE